MGRTNHLLSRLFLGVVLISAPGLLSCAQPNIEIALLDPEGARDNTNAEWAQMAIFPDACPSDNKLAYGRVETAVYLDTVAVDQDFTPIGEWKKGAFAFVAYIRQKDCAVLAVGCTLADLEKHRKIAIQLDPVSPPAGTCDGDQGESCQGGVCQ